MRSMKLIDATYQDKELKWYLDTNSENGVTYIPDFVIKKILNCAAVDAAPISHAHWEEVNWHSHWGDEVFKM